MSGKLTVQGEQSMRRLGRSQRLLAVGLVVAFHLFLTPIALRADRGAGQSASGRALEKAGKHTEAALYYQRAMLAFREVWRKFWPHIDAAIVKEYEDRLTGCLEEAHLGTAQLENMGYINTLWVEEYIDQELGGFKLAFPYRAEEAEKHGDFLLAEQLHLAAADFYRIVAIPYHEQMASQPGKPRTEAALHRQIIEEYELRAEKHKRMAQGDKILGGMGGLQAPQSPPAPSGLSQHYFKVYHLYHERVLSFEESRWLTGRTPQQVAEILKQGGLRHPKEAARFASVVVLAQLGERDAVLTALEDPSSQVRRAAAEALASFRWATGWAACYQHKDQDVRKTIDPLLECADNQPLARTATIVELLQGLDSSSDTIRSFSREALSRITGRALLSADQWHRWWADMGHAQPGLRRSVSGGSAVVDDVIDFGAWWQSGMYSIQNRPNPFANYSFPVKILWRGHLAVARSGQYRFFLRNRGNKGHSSEPSNGLFTSPCAQLFIDGEAVLSDPKGVVEDTYPYMRIDYSEAIELEAGLHEILLEFAVESADPKFGMGPHNKDRKPCVRLYWSSEHFLRQLIPVEHLIHLDKAEH
jgi:hypothetical protein